MDLFKRVGKEVYTMGDASQAKELLMLSCTEKCGITKKCNRVKIFQSEKNFYFGWSHLLYCLFYASMNQLNSLTVNRLFPVISKQFPDIQIPLPCTPKKSFVHDLAEIICHLPKIGKNLNKRVRTDFIKKILLSRHAVAELEGV